MTTEVINIRDAQARSRDLVIRFVEHTSRKFFTRYKDPALTVLAPEDQHAMRIFAAAIRRIENEYDAVYAEDPQKRLRAALALVLNDNGDLVRYAGVAHSRGRMACPGCSFAYQGLQKEPQCVLCPRCKMGVEHIHRVFGPCEFADGIYGSPLYLKVGETVDWRVCDECKTNTITPVKD